MLAVRNLGPGLAARYEMEHRSFFFRLYLDIVFAEFIRNGRTYMGTESFKFVCSKCGKRLITRRFSWKYRLEA